MEIPPPEIGVADFDLPSRGRLSLNRFSRRERAFDLGVAGRGATETPRTKA
jgi:hypothetical protein